MARLGPSARRAAARAARAPGRVAQLRHDAAAEAQRGGGAPARRDAPRGAGDEGSASNMPVQDCWSWQDCKQRQNSGNWSSHLYLITKFFFF
jgi:hypothetical protein